MSPLEKLYYKTINKKLNLTKIEESPIGGLHIYLRYKEHLFKRKERVFISVFAADDKTIKIKFYTYCEEHEDIDYKNKIRDVAFELATNIRDYIISNGPVNWLRPVSDNYIIKVIRDNDWVVPHATREVA